MTQSYLPILTDAQEALKFYRSTNPLNDAQRAYVIAFLSREGWTNRQIRSELGIEKVYTLTHYRRVGLALSESEFALWSKNPDRITLGHLRALCHLKPEIREPLLRNVLAHKLSVSKLQQRIRGNDQRQNGDIKRYEAQMEGILGRGVKIHFDINRQSGKLTLDFFGLDDLDQIANSLGFQPEFD